MGNPVAAIVLSSGFNSCVWAYYFVLRNTPREML